MSGTASASAPDTTAREGAGGKVSVYMFSGTSDKFLTLGCITESAAALGMEVHVFVTGFSILAFTKEHHDLPFPADYAHLAKWVTEGMAAANVAPWEEMVHKARELGAKFHGCSMMSAILGLNREDLRDDLIDDVIGLATFLRLAEHGETYYV
jgi:peroxiredoxin family protein